MAPQPDRANPEERTHQLAALEYRIKGHTWDEVAAMAGYASKGSAHRAVFALLGRVESEGASELRALEDARLDAMLRVVWPMVLDGDLKAIDRALNISAARRRLHGLDKIAVEMSTSGVDVEVLKQQLVELLDGGPAPEDAAAEGRS